MRLSGLSGFYGLFGFYSLFGLFNIIGRAKCYLLDMCKMFSVSC